MSLHEWGWTPERDREFEPFAQQGCLPARVTTEHKHIYTVHAGVGDFTARVSGKFRFEAGAKSAFPAVGDWVAIEARPEEEAATIQALMPRQSAFVRKAAGAVTEEQVVAANVNTAFLVCGLDGDFNLRRIERYLTLTWESGAIPVIILNKCDLCEDIPGRIAETGSVAFGVPILAVSGATGNGLEGLREHLAPGKTVVFLGSSGVGKSTLVNALLGSERQAVSAVREDDSRGRHTTTSRELILLPGGGVMIDTPGMRELQLWGDENGLKRAFEDIETLASGCRFRDCTHQGEPGCAVEAALESGELDADRFEGYLKQRKELAYLARRTDQRAQMDEKMKWKHIAMEIRRMNKNR